MKPVFFLNIFNGDKKSVIAVNNCLDLYFNASIIGNFLICLVPFHNLRKGTLKRCLLVCQEVEVGKSFGDCSAWGDWG